MRIIAVSVGGPREVEWNGRSVRTSIYKSPVSGPVRVRQLNLEGDQQSDLTVHGGIDKAIYAYPSEHYEFWQKEMPGTELPWGFFGENLTTAGLLENDVSIGDRFRIGSAELAVTQPRMPCFKLGIRFNDPRMIKRFLVSLRTGFYLQVLKEGELVGGDAIEPIARETDGLTVADITNLYAAASPEPEKLHRASTLAALPASWREHFRQRLAAS